MIYNLHQYFCNLQNMFTPFRKKTMETRIIKNIFNKNERNVGTSKPKKHVNKVGRLTGPKIKQTTSI